MTCFAEYSSSASGSPIDIEISFSPALFAALLAKVSANTFVK
jgi:hypothetical protein